MRRAVILGVVLVCAAVLFASGGTEAQRTKVIEVIGTVDVGNFPAVQQVSGAVNVGNLPAIQQVTGTVDVGNLPVDAQGNVRVAGNLLAVPQKVRFVGYTAATYPNKAPFSPASVECNADFPGSRACVFDEFVLSIPAPPIDPVRPCVLASFRTANGDFDGVLTAYDMLVGSVNSCPSTGVPPFPAACCGF